MTPNSVLIYTPQSTNRLVYIFDLLLTDLLGLKYTLTHDTNEFTNADLPKFSYSKTPIGNEVFFSAVNLLWEITVVPQPIAIVEYKNMAGFYPALPPSALPFDVFASSFYMVSRYLEYLPSKHDNHGRFRGSQSHIVKAGYIEKPLVNMYALEIKALLAEKFPSLVFKTGQFQYIPTFDIDIAYSYSYKGWKRNLGGMAKAFLISDFSAIKDRILVLLNRKKDPFDNYDYILEECKKHNLHPLFFILLGDPSRFDKNIDPEHPAFCALIKRLANAAKMGIHLSYKSHIDPKIGRKEIERLEEIIDDIVTINRYHYLRFELPISYQSLIKQGITDDYSMGYGPHAGFRAGICTPFYFFNLRANERTELKIHPIAFMDTTFTHYYRHNNREAMRTLRNIIKNVYEVNGTLYGLWHNSSFSEQREWKGWRKIFEKVSEEASALMQKDE